ncbi:MAG: hypothetical protein ACOCPT_05920 [Halanaeroarchaeum sp.]
MDVGRLVVSLARAYVVALVLVAAITVLWIVSSTPRGPTAVAALWFAVAGFGVLVLVIVGVVEVSRR